MHDLFISLEVKTHKVKSYLFQAIQFIFLFQLGLIK